jgi:Spy/CpxP family protein refolding chaperone
MAFPTAKTLVQATAALMLIGLATSPAARAADTTPPSTTTTPATAPCPSCPWGGGPGMMGPGMMWNMTPEQRQQHWQYMRQHMGYGPGMMGPGMMYGPWGGTSTANTP